MGWGMMVFFGVVSVGDVLWKYKINENDWPFLCGTALERLCSVRKP